MSRWSFYDVKVQKCTCEVSREMIMSTHVMTVTRIDCKARERGMVQAAESYAKGAARAKCDTSCATAKSRVEKASRLARRHAAGLGMRPSLPPPCRRRIDTVRGRSDTRDARCAIHDTHGAYRCHNRDVARTRGGSRRGAHISYTLATAFCYRASLRRCSGACAAPSSRVSQVAGTARGHGR